MEKKVVQHLCTELSGINSSLKNINNLLEELCGQFAQINNSGSLNGAPFWSSKSISESLENISSHLGELAGAKLDEDESWCYEDNLQTALNEIANEIERK